MKIENCKNNVNTNVDTTTKNKGFLMVDAFGVVFCFLLLLNVVDVPVVFKTMLNFLLFVILLFFILLLHVFTVSFHRTWM
jgi:hypothetical protein